MRFAALLPALLLIVSSPVGAQAAAPLIVTELPPEVLGASTTSDEQFFELAFTFRVDRDRTAYVKVLPVPRHPAFFNGTASRSGWWTDVHFGGRLVGSLDGADLVPLGLARGGLDQRVLLRVHAPAGALVQPIDYPLAYAVAASGDPDSSASGGSLDPSVSIATRLVVDGPVLSGPPPDTSPPAWPAVRSLVPSSIGATSLTLTWTEATDNVGITSYRILRDGLVSGILGGSVLSHRVLGLVGGRTYLFKVEASDAAGHVTTDGPSVQATTAGATTGGGGGGGGGGGSAPATAPSTAAPSPSPSPTSPDVDQDGVPDDLERILGTDPTDPESRPDYDLSDRLVVRWQGEDIRLTWPLVLGAKGYQLWRATSPWSLVATLSPSTTTFLDEGVPAGARYKLTYFTAYDLSHGFVAATEADDSLWGWDADAFQVPVEPGGAPTPDDAPAAGPEAQVALLISIFAIVAIALITTLGPLLVAVRNRPPSLPPLAPSGSAGPGPVRRRPRPPGTRSRRAHLPTRNRIAPTANSTAEELAALQRLLGAYAVPPSRTQSSPEAAATLPRHEPEAGAPTGTLRTVVPAREETIQQGKVEGAGAPSDPHHAEPGAPSTSRDSHRRGARDEPAHVAQSGAPDRAVPKPLVAELPEASLFTEALREFLRRVEADLGGASAEASSSERSETSGTGG